MSDVREVAGGSGKWSEPGVPHKGWRCVGVEDLGAPEECCAMCERTQIRYVHVMEHDEYPDALRCGCVCAGHMEGDYEKARAREEESRGRSARKSRWLSLAWRTSREGNPYLKHRGGSFVVVYPKRGGWGFMVRTAPEREPIHARKTYPSEQAAKLASFDALEWAREKGR
jgi:hypothetical protein